MQSRPGPPPVGVPSSSQGGRGAPPAYSIPQGGPGHGYGEGRGHYNRNRGEAHAVGAAGGSRGARSASSSSANNRYIIYKKFFLLLLTFTPGFHSQFLEAVQNAKFSAFCFVLSKIQNEQ